MAEFLMPLLLLTSFVGRIASLSVTVNDVECVYEYVLYENDIVSGNFVVVDHDIFWNSDHPGIDLTVMPPIFSPFSFQILRFFLGFGFKDLIFFFRGKNWVLVCDLGLI